MPVATPLSSPEGSLVPGADILVRLPRLAVADAEVLEPALDLVGAGGQVPLIPESRW